MRFLYTAYLAYKLGLGWDLWYVRVGENECPIINSMFKAIVLIWRRSDDFEMVCLFLESLFSNSNYNHPLHSVLRESILPVLVLVRKENSV